MSFLGSLFGGDAAMDAVNQNRGLIKGFQTKGNQIIDTGEGKSLGALNSAIGAYNPYAQAGSGAVGLLGGALGLNGAEGTKAAQDAFQTGPGYQFALDQGTQAALRGASAGGMLGSGNTLTALAQYGQGLANQEYGSWLDRLQGLSSQGLQAAGGQAAGYGSIADLYQGTADDRLGLESNIVQGLMGNNNEAAQIKEQQGGFLGGLIGKGLSFGLKAATGGLF